MGLVGGVTQLGLLAGEDLFWWHGACLLLLGKVGPG